MVQGVACARPAIVEVQSTCTSAALSPWPMIGEKPAHASDQPTSERSSIFGNSRLLHSVSKPILMKAGPLSRPLELAPALQFADVGQGCRPRRRHHVGAMRHEPWGEMRGCDPAWSKDRPGDELLTG